MYELVNGWQDLLRQNEIERLITAWDDVSGFELRMTRVGRLFAAYALFPSEPPMPFSLPVPAVAKYLGLHDDQAPQ